MQIRMTHRHLLAQVLLLTFIGVTLFAYVSTLRLQVAVPATFFVEKSQVKTESKIRANRLARFYGPHFISLLFFSPYLEAASANQFADHRRYRCHCVTYRILRLESSIACASER